MKHLKKIILITIIVCGIILVFSLLLNNQSLLKEGFTWNSKSTTDFLNIQRTQNRNKIFDVKMIQENQASQEELNYFLENGLWPWSQKTKELYEKSSKKNPLVRNYSKDSIKDARKIYNEAAILRVLSYQTNEGRFLLDGVLIKNPSGNKYEVLPSGFGDFALSKESGLLENRSDDIIKCNMDNSNNARLDRITYMGRGGIFGEQRTNTTQVDYNNLDEIIPGFTFLKGPCNPCGAINKNADYSCPFRLKVKNNPPFVSEVWQHLWGLNDNQ